MADSIKNFSYSTVLTAPSPATSGTSLTVQSGDGAKFAVGNAVVWPGPVGTLPTVANAEIVRVTAVSTDTFTIIRNQDSSTAMSIAVGYQIDQGVTAGLLAQYATLLGTYDAQVANLSPSAWWKLSDAVSSTTALDSSGNGYTGTVTGGVTFGQAGAISGNPLDTAALFDGTTGYISSSISVPNVSTAVNAWFNMPASSINGAVFNTQTSGGFQIGVSNGYFGGVGNILTLGLPFVSDISTGKVVSTGWHMATVSLDGSGHESIYLDGVLVFSYATAPRNGTALWGIGTDGGSLLWPSSIAQAAVFPTALTAAQVLALYNSAPNPSDTSKLSTSGGVIAGSLTVDGTAVASGTKTTGSVVTSPAVSSGTAFTPSATLNSMVYFQINAAIAGSYTLTMGPSTGAENTVGSGVAMVIGSDDVVTIPVPATWKVVLTLTSVTLSRTTVVTA